MKNSKTLYDNKWFSVVETEGEVGIHSKRMSVAILPYRVNEFGLITEVGILNEYNLFREGNFADTLITGTVEYEDDSLLLTAIRELEEEGGFTMPPNSQDRWIFLGPVFLQKDSDKMIPIFAVDVTDIEQKDAVGDGSKKELNSKLYMKDASVCVTNSEGLVLSAFLRLFNYMYSKTTTNL